MSFYIFNALGFFIQLTPCVLMVFLPFPEESFRYPRKPVLICAAAAAGVLSALFPPALRASGFDMMGDLLMLLAALLTLVAVVWLVREPAIKKVLAVFVVLFYAVCQFWLVNTVWLWLPDVVVSRAEYSPYPPLTAGLYAASAAVTLPVMVRFVIRPLGGFLRETEPGKTRREFASAIVSTTALMGTMMYVYNYGYNSSYYRVIVLLEFILIADQLLIYWLVFQESLRRARDAERQRALEVQKLQYDKISREMENTRRLRHDLRHHLKVLGTLNAQGRQEEIAAYLKEYGAVADRLDNLKLSGDPVANGVLGYYLTRAEELGVKAEYEVTLGPDSGVEATDMTVLLGNCLENSLKALERLPEGRRRLSLELKPAKGMVLLRIRNTCEEGRDSGGPSGWTAFSGGGTSGVGLSSVNAIAEKYNGSAVFERRDGVFTTRVSLNIGQRGL